MSVNKLVVYGGAGALGRTLVQHFKTKGYVSSVTIERYHNHVFNPPPIYLQAVINVDLVENKDADFNALTSGTGSLAEQEKIINESITSVLGAEKLCAIFCVAGGWAGGNAGSKGKKKKRALVLYDF